MSGCNLDVIDVDKIVIVARTIGAKRTRPFIGVVKRCQDSFVRRARRDGWVARGLRATLVVPVLAVDNSYETANQCTEALDNQTTSLLGNIGDWVGKCGRGGGDALDPGLCPTTKTCHESKQGRVGRDGIFEPGNVSGLLFLIQEY